MLINDNALGHWMDNFYGYGSWRAPLWFVSYEEGGGELPEEVAEKVDYFIAHHAADASGVLCNIRELYQHIAYRDEGPKGQRYATRHDYRFGDQPMLNGIWKNLIAFIHGYRNQPLPDLLAYQAKNFLSSSLASEALIPLYPLPSPHSHAWYYSWLDMPRFAFLKKRATYEQHVYRQRIDTILANVAAHRPAVVLMYGMNNINTLKQSVQAHFSSAKFTMVKAAKLETPQHHRADLGGTTLLVTTQIPALRHNRVETGFDWYGFGQKAAN